jgi:Ca2+-transporting ATPase
MQDFQQSADFAYRRSGAETVADLGSDARSGLSANEARQRLERIGRNELESERRLPAWKEFLAQFTDPLVVLLLIATAISAALWVYERDTLLPYEALTIFTIVLLNAILGYWQQARAAQAVAALRKMSAAHSTVIRDGVQASIEAAEIVPGDVIIIEEGDTIPADARLLRVTALQTVEAGLTGESLPVAKQVEPVDGEAGLGDQLNMVFSGTAVSYGRGRAVVTATGMRTQMGRIADMLAGARAETTPLQKELARVGRMLGVIVIVIATVMIATIILVEEVHGLSALFDVLIFGVALAVAAVPEGLPAVVTAVLALGVQRMARRQAIVRHLAAVETLGSASIIASDKTGTLTRNEMTVRAVVTASGRVDFEGTGYAPEGAVSSGTPGAPVQIAEGPLRQELERALAVGDLANNAVLQQVDGRWTIQGDPTEGALIVAARKAGMTRDALGARFQRLAEVPFSSERKLMTTVHKDAEKQDRLLVFTKGAPDVLLGRCTHEFAGGNDRRLDDARRAQIAASNEALAQEALRTLAVAYRALPANFLEAEDADEDLEHDLVFAGLIGMIDPPRAEAKEAAARARAAGIRVVMITGDHPITAAVIAKELGISSGERATTGSELAKMPDDELQRVVRGASVYARVNPEQKLRLVKALQRDGAIVAMTGDGVNDAPALKTADIGVAMGITGTDVSKEASDIVLSDDNFATIVAAVEEGRAIFANIRKFLRYLLSSNIGEVLTMFFGVVFAQFLGLSAAASGAVALPLLATQLLWINLVSDGAPALALGVDPADEDVMAQRPRPRSERVITGRMWWGILFTGIVTAAGTLLALDSSLPGGLVEGTSTLAHGQTMAFTTLVFFSLFTVFNSRSDERSAFSGLFSNPALWISVAASLLLQVAVVYLPFLQQAFSTTALSGADWLYCLTLGSSVLWLREAWKVIARSSRHARRGTAEG